MIRYSSTVQVATDPGKAFGIKSHTSRRTIKPTFKVAENNGVAEEKARAVAAKLTKQQMNQACVEIRAASGRKIVITPGTSGRRGRPRKNLQVGTDVEGPIPTGEFLQAAGDNSIRG